MSQKSIEQYHPGKYLLAHDMKASAALCGGILKRLLQGKSGSMTAKQKKYLQILVKEHQKLDNNLGRFLLAQNHNTGREQLHCSPCSLEEIVNQVLEKMSWRAREKDVWLQLDLAEDPPLILADPEQLERVISNLLDNALKYTPSLSTILLWTWDDGDYSLLDVRDQGPGITAEELNRIFKPFYRSQRCCHIEGNGLGLASAQSIINAHGGRIWGESIPNRGASFYLQIPINNKDGSQL